MSSSFLGEEDDECPYCQECMPVFTYRGNERTRYSCCGNFICNNCNELVKDRILKCEVKRDNVLANRSNKITKEESTNNINKCHSDKNNNQSSSSVQARAAAAVESDYQNSIKCPFCREELPDKPEDDFNVLLKHANEGKGWAQHTIGARYMKGYGVQPSFKKAMKWFRLAADQGHPLSMCEYGRCLCEGDGIPRPLPKEGEKWLQKSIETGNERAQAILGEYYLNGKGGLGSKAIKKDVDNGIRLLRLSANKGCDLAEYTLGYSYWYGNGVPKDLDQAIILLKKVAEKKVNAMSAIAMANVGACLMDRANEKYGNVDIPGKCPMPEAMKYARMAVANGDNQIGPKLIYQIENLGCMKFCSNKDCYKSDYFQHDQYTCKKLLRCNKCKLMKYCSKDCQRKHWKAGHKIDCCSQDNTAAI